jgi:hypothetical protein
MSGDEGRLYWNTGKASKLATLECKEMMYKPPTPGGFAKRAHKILKIKDRGCKKRARVQKMLKII